MNRAKNIMQYWWTALYCPIYMMFFYIVEHLHRRISIISIGLDHKIPFCEYFVIPYFMWFPYIVIMYLIFFFKDKKEFVNFIKYLYMGMTFFIIFSFLFPNGLDIRPTYFAHDNIFVHMVQRLYASDTATNVAPSIHAYNSIVVAVMALRSKNVITKNWQKIFCLGLSGTIILSTLLIKQHSVVDIIGAGALAVVGYKLYCTDYEMGFFQRRRVANVK